MYIFYSDVFYYVCQGDPKTAPASHDLLGLRGFNILLVVFAAALLQQYNTKQNKQKEKSHEAKSSGVRAFKSPFLTELYFIPSETCDNTVKHHLSGKQVRCSAFQIINDGGLVR